MRPDRKNQHGKIARSSGVPSSSGSNSASDVHLVCGRNSVKEVLKHRPELVERLLCTSTTLDELKREGFDAHKYPVDVRSGKELENLLHTTSHQGICAELSGSQEITFEQLSDADFLGNGVVLALDGVQDPHNLGALFRAAECFGVKALLWSRNRTVAVTPAVTKVAVGATELVPFCMVGNLSQALSKLKERAVWILVAANGAHAKQAYEGDLPGPKCLIMGSEGDGASHALRELADLEVFAPMQGKIDSLNVSQAGAVLLSGLVRAC